MNRLFSVLFFLTAALFAMAPPARGQTSSSQVACPTQNSALAANLPTVPQPCKPVPFTGNGNGETGKGLSQGYLASIIPTPGLTSSSVCGTTGVRCAADASKASSGQGEALNQERSGPMRAAAISSIQTLASFPVFYRQGDGSYLVLFYGGSGTTLPLLSPASSLTQWLSAGLPKLLASPSVPAGTAMQSQFFSLADLDGNGTMGFAQTDGNTVEILRSTTSADLSTLFYTIGPDVNSTFLADFNGDGKPDLAVAFDGSNTVPGGIAILLNKGDGTFGTPVVYASGTQATRFAVFDLNHDGILDIATAQLGGGVTVLLGQKGGTFGSPNPYGTGAFGLSSGQAIAIADFNGDGNPDIVEGGPAGILLGNGDGTFRAGKPLPAVASGSLIWAFAAGDLNGDGKMDLVYSDIENQVAAPLFGNGDGTFYAGQTYDLQALPDSLVLADVNNDGRLDIINGAGDQRIFGPGDNSAGVDILLNNGDGTFAGVATYFSLPNAESGGNFNNQGSLAVAKFGGTGAGVLVSALGGLTLLQGDGKGDFQAPQAISVSGSAGAIAAADFTGDGLPDAAVATGNGVVILPGTNTGFGSPSTAASGISGAVMASGDFNKDGNADLALAGAGSVAILLGKGGGAFSTPLTFSGVPSPTALAVADLNGDGLPDLVVADSGSTGSGGGVYVMLNLVNGAFHAPVSVYSGLYPVFGVADVNGDGKLDLVVAAQAGTAGESQVSWLQGKGDGTFLASAGITNSPFPDTAILVQDFNGDGYPDVVLGNEGPTTTFMFGNGDGTFSSEVPFVSAAQTQPMYFAQADFNGDGLPDLVVAGLTISVLFNSGPPSAVTIQTNPPGLAFRMDNDAPLIAPQTLSLSQGPHFIAVGTAQPNTAGTEYAFTGWSDGGAGEHMITVGSSAATYTASFTASGTSTGPTILSVTTADGGATIAQNTFIVIKGTDLVPATTSASGAIWSTAPSFAQGLMPTQLNGVSVTVNNKPAFVYFYCSAATDAACSQDQLNILTPLDNTVGSVQVVVTSATGSAAYTVTMQAQAPAFLLFGATEYIAATHANNSLIGPASLYPGQSTPANTGEEIQLYAVGFGLPSTMLVNDSAMQTGSLPVLPKCTVGNSSASVAFAGLISPGLYQINLTIPAGASSGDNLVTCTYNGTATPTGALITVQ